MTTKRAIAFVLRAVVASRDSWRAGEISIGAHSDRIEINAARPWNLLREGGTAYGE
jgi:hypothetical protein